MISDKIKIVHEFRDNKTVEWYKFIKCEYRWDHKIFPDTVFLPACFLCENGLMKPSQITGDRLDYYMDFKNHKIDGKNIDELDLGDQTGKDAYIECAKFARIVYYERTVYDDYEKERDVTNREIKKDFKEFVRNATGDCKMLNEEKIKCLLKTYILFYGARYRENIKIFDFEHYNSDKLYNANRFEYLNRLLFNCEKDNGSFINFYGGDYDVNSEVLRKFYSILIVNFIKTDSDLMVYLYVLRMFHEEICKIRTIRNSIKTGEVNIKFDSYSSGAAVAALLNDVDYLCRQEECERYLRFDFGSITMNMKILLHFLGLNERKKRKFIGAIFDNETDRWTANISVEDRTALWDILDNVELEGFFYNEMGEWLSSLNKDKKIAIVRFIVGENNVKESEICKELNKWGGRIRSISFLMSYSNGNNLKDNKWWVYINIVTARIVLPIFKTKTNNSKFSVPIKISNDRKYNEKNKQHLNNMLNHSLNKKSLSNIFKDGSKFFPELTQEKLCYLKDLANKDKCTLDDIREVYGEKISDFKYNLFVLIERISLMGNSLYYQDLNAVELFDVRMLELVKKSVKDNSLLDLLKL